MRWFAAIFCAAVTAVHAVPSGAQAVCGDRADLIGKLAKTHSEGLVGMGLTSAGAVIEVLTSAAGTWTILVTYPRGPTCAVATGENWETLPIVAAGTIS